MPGGGENSSKSSKKKEMVVVSDMDGITRATAPANSSGRASHRDRDDGGGGGSGGRGGGSRKRPLRDIEGEARFTGREMRLTAAVAILTIVLFGLASFVVVSGPLTGLLKPVRKVDELSLSSLMNS